MYWFLRFVIMCKGGDENKKEIMNKIIEKKRNK